MTCTMIQQPSKLQGRTTRGTWTQYTCSKTRVKLQNIAYKSFKIVRGWGFTPNPTGRAYTAPSHHPVSCMGIAIHTPPPLSRPLPYVQCPLPKQLQNRLRTRNMVTSHAVASKLLHYKHRPMVSTPVVYTTISTRCRMLQSVYRCNCMRLR